MATVFLGLGSNLGDREANIRMALNKLESQPEVKVRAVSSFYLTAPVGFRDQPDFVNAVAAIETDLSPKELLDVVLKIEREMGRVRNFKWGPRIIDIDILLYNNVRVNTDELVIPHPRMTERAFVMAPLAEIAPDLALPDGRTPNDVLKELKNQSVRKLSEVR
ncbi:MAG: 2-amino-4-hydroxy-6-hydroxymethyldihydropteridine diphosphokinase [Armatimonadetes bacterium]|nr:2-amino-4-hydroxy-6-hydroxymethyldihydropteridine diphosphokinase [Armatimonadota bacterium]